MINQVELEIFRQLETLQNDRALLGADPATDRAELAELDAAIVDLREAHTTIITRRFEREQEIERAAKHAAIIPLCRVSLDLYHEKNRATESANGALAGADSALAGAAHRLRIAHDSKPKGNAYPTRKEIADWEGRVRLAEDELIKARERRVAAVQNRDRLSVETSKAREEFGKLDLQERLLRGPEKPPEIIATGWRIQTGPELTGVR